MTRPEKTEESPTIQSEKKSQIGSDTVTEVGSEAAQTEKMAWMTSDSLKLLLQCTEPLLIFKKHQALAFTIN